MDALTNPLLALGLALGLATACAESNPPPPSTASQQSTQTASRYQAATPPGETSPAGGNPWGSTNPQPSDRPMSGGFSPDQSMTASSTANATNDSPSSGSTALPGMPSDSDLSKLDDPQFAAVIQSLHDGEIRLGQLVIGQTTNPDVKRFAHDMVVSHQAMLNKAKALWSGIHLTPSANEVSGQLDADTQNDASNLTSMHGDALDRQYADTQVRAHMNASDLVAKIIPDVKNASFKADLTAAQPKLQIHLRMAEALKKQLEKGVTSRQPSNQIKP
jgi:putative membrane protein